MTRHRVLYMQSRWSSLVKWFLNSCLYKIKWALKNKGFCFVSFFFLNQFWSLLLVGKTCLEKAISFTTHGWCRACEASGLSVYDHRSIGCLSRSSWPLSTCLHRSAATKRRTRLATVPAGVPLCTKRVRSAVQTILVWNALKTWPSTHPNTVSPLQNPGTAPKR